MNAKTIMILMIITIGMSFGCIENTSEITIQEHTPTEIELVEVEYYENSTSNPFVEPTFDALSESTTESSLEPTATPTIIPEQTPLPNLTPEQTMDYQTIIDRIKYLQDEFDRLELGEKQTECSSSIRLIEEKIENNPNIELQIKYLNERLLLLLEETKEYEQELERLPILNDEIEKINNDIQLIQDEISDNVEKLEDESLSNEEKLNINNDIWELQEELDHIKYDILRHKTSELNILINALEAREVQIKLIEEHQTEKQALEEIYLSPDDIENLEAEIEDILAEKKIYSDMAQVISEELIELRTLLVELR
ncbi:MAG: hypothetical protein C5S41_11960 [Candidatus Methanomarinus sp.]|nr:MAG: hypothetical protein C5S41_11960 [ANME-2 cluster archaeon]